MPTKKPRKASSAKVSAKVMPLSPLAMSSDSTVLRARVVLGNPHVFGACNAKSEGCEEASGLERHTTARDPLLGMAMVKELQHWYDEHNATRLIHDAAQTLLGDNLNEQWSDDALRMLREHMFFRLCYVATHGIVDHDSVLETTVEDRPVGEGRVTRFQEIADGVQGSAPAGTCVAAIVERGMPPQSEGGEPPPRYLVGFGTEAVPIVVVCQIHDHGVGRSPPLCVPGSRSKDRQCGTVVTGVYRTPADADADPTFVSTKLASWNKKRVERFYAVHPNHRLSNQEKRNEWTALPSPRGWNKIAALRCMAAILLMGAGSGGADALQVERWNEADEQLVEQKTVMDVRLQPFEDLLALLPFVSYAAVFHLEFDCAPPSFTSPGHYTSTWMAVVRDGSCIALLHVDGSTHQRLRGLFFGASEGKAEILDRCAAMCASPVTSSGLPQVVVREVFLPFRRRRELLLCWWLGASIDLMRSQSPTTDRGRQQSPLLRDEHLSRLLWDVRSLLLHSEGDAAKQIVTIRARGQSDSVASTDHCPHGGVLRVRSSLGPSANDGASATEVVWIEWSGSGMTALMSIDSEPTCKKAMHAPFNFRFFGPTGPTLGAAEAAGMPPFVVAEYRMKRQGECQ